MKLVLCATWVLGLCMLLLSGCFEPQDYMQNKDSADKTDIIEKSGLANPASMYCMNQTGTYMTFKEGPNGEFGVCHFSDGSWCEEWAYFKGRCAPGTNLTSCEGQFWGKATCPPDYDPVCASIDVYLLDESGRRSDVLLKSKKETFSNACKACVASTEEQEILGYVIGSC